MFGEIGFDKLLLLLVVFLLLFGAKRIPEIGRSLGKGIREFKGSLAGLDEPVESLRAAEKARPQVTSLPLAATATDAFVEAHAVRRLGS
jgi:sec-independent protein translocase protein TatA